MNANDNTASKTEEKTEDQKQPVPALTLLQCFEQMPDEIKNIKINGAVFLLFKDDMTTNAVRLNVEEEGMYQCFAQLLDAHIRDKTEAQKTE